MAPQDEADLELGRLVRQIAVPFQSVTILSLGDDGAYVIVGRERQRADGIRGTKPWDLLNSAVAEGLRKLGSIPGMASASGPPKAETIKQLRGAP